ncbi:MAG: bifunctional glycosyltransferase family 2 protein/CDP-glycerol:glycerophosphate glycerophosphotransferase, partial [Coriobacteriia bacterium]|nr:bifunctional glycosyltransferase family 2 protein/CDP-glycerol:glycerophosphate glycerophosphotransferase [Coriobacteriia bacterium]
NAGVSAASNTGLEQVKGKYVTTMGSDDKWSKNAFKKGYAFLEKHADEIDVVSFRIVFFEAKTSPHALDYKFDYDRIVNINEEYDHIQMGVATTLIRTEAIQGARFDRRFGFGEDTKFITPVILEKQKYGIISSSIYFYRSREAGTSIGQTTTFDRSYYFDAPVYGLQYLLDYSKEKFGEVLPYVQYLVMYDIQWRIRVQELPDDFTDEETAQYKQLLRQLLADIDDRMIVEQRFLLGEYKLHALSMKYDTDKFADLELRKGRVWVDEYPLTPSADAPIAISIIEAKNGILNIEGHASYFAWLSNQDFYYVINGEERVSVTFFDSPVGERYSLGEKFCTLQCFKVEIPLDGLEKIDLFTESSTEKIRLRQRFGAFAKIRSDFKWAYFVLGDYIVKYQRGSLRFYRNEKATLFKSELRYLGELLKRKEFDVASFRLACHALRVFKKKKIWLISDRIVAGNDNGEALFKHAVNQGSKSIKPYFVLAKDCPDYKRMKKIGSVVKYNGLKYQFLFALSDKIISSSGDHWVTSLPKRSSAKYKDLFISDFVFLGHGITLHDLSKWLNKHSKDIKLFITAARPEHESIIDGNYLYGSDVVKLTGLPRYDYLQTRNQEKQILFLPTWRLQLAGKFVDGVRQYNPDFTESDYYKSYNRLINDSKLLEAMKQHGYTGKMYMHSSFIKQAKDFQENEIISVSREDCKYSEELGESALLVSDYSSVVFDFAYLKKPVFYYQFDYDTFYESHTVDKGYFSFEEHGFGEVCYDHNVLVEAIIKEIENNCAMEEKYKNRVEDFFYKFDKDNSKRVYEEITEL